MDNFKKQDILKKVYMNCMEAFTTCNATNVFRSNKMILSLRSITKKWAVKFYPNAKSANKYPVQIFWCSTITHEWAKEVMPKNKTTESSLKD